MQNKDPRTLRIAGESVPRFLLSAHMRQSVTNLCRQATDVLRIPSGVQEVQGTTSGCRDARLAVASKPMPIGASFMISLLAGGSICLMADDFYAGSRPASSVRILVKLFHPAGQTTLHLGITSLLQGNRLDRQNLGPSLHRRLRTFGRRIPAESRPCNHAGS